MQHAYADSGPAAIWTMVDVATTRALSRVISRSDIARAINSVVRQARLPRSADGSPHGLSAIKAQQGPYWGPKLPMLFNRTGPGTLIYVNRLYLWALRYRAWIRKIEWPPFVVALMSK